jgi:glutaredoxin 3
MSSVVLYTTRWCPFCVQARALLDQKGVDYRNVDVGAEPERREEMRRLAGRNSVPQIWIGDHHVGGCDELMMLERAGRLDAMLKQNNGNG